MSKPIPADIMARARDAADELHLRNDYMHGETVKVVAKALLAAVEEEREACAKAAGNYLMLKTPLDVPRIVECENAIRNRSVTEGEAP